MLLECFGMFTDRGSWNVIWREEEGSPGPQPATMCQGKQGQIITWNREADGKGISMFNITEKRFYVAVPQLKLGLWPRHLCYCELPGVGGALAVTDYYTQHKLCMYSLERGTLLWTVGGKNKNGEWVKVAGAEWKPQGVCCDNRGHLYVADYNCYKEGNNRILVFSAESGELIQEIKHRELRRPEHIIWQEETKSIIVYNYGHKNIIHIKIEF